MICPNCHSEMEQKLGEYHFTESGLDNVWLSNWPLFICTKCDARMPMLPNPEEFTRTLVKQLVEEEHRLNGDAITFIRKRMGLTSEQLATVLGVQRTELSRWENDKRPISFEADFKLRMEATKRLLAPETVRDVCFTVAERFTNYKHDRSYAPITIEKDLVAV